MQSITDTSHQISCNLNFIHELQGCMLTKTNMDKSLSFTLDVTYPHTDKANDISNFYHLTNKADNSKADNSKVENNICKEDVMYTPVKKDTLFWCFYIIKNGMENFNMIDNQHFIIEKNAKISAIELLREKKDLLKSHKIKSLSEIETDLTNSSEISIKTFFALVIIYGLNVLYIKNNAYYEFLSDEISGDETTVIHVIKWTNKKYAYECIQSPIKVVEYRAKYYKMGSIDKPVQAITSYKINELLELSKKLGIDFQSLYSIKKPTKKDIYDAIVAYFL
jgi:hypothetical protein